MTFVAHDEPTIVEQPTDRAFDLPTSFVASKWSTVLSCRAFATASVWTNQLDATLCQPLSQGITVGRFVINQSLGAFAHGALVQERLNEVDLRRTGTGDVDAERRAAAVDEEHDLRPLAAFGLADTKPPFLAGENVPSAIASSKRSDFIPSSRWSSRRQAIWKIPLWVHS